MKFSIILRRFLKWRVENVDHRRFLYLLSFVVGLLSALAAVLLKNSIHYLADFLSNWFDKGSGNYLYLATPLIGITLAFLFVKYIVKDKIGHGISRILYAISRKNSKIKSHNSWSSIIASSLTIGFGGSVGAEAPIVLTGASIGSNIGRMMKMNYKNVTLLVGCGAAGAVSGIFNAPIAGIVFTLEILMLDLTVASIVPLLISSVTATTVSFFLMGKGSMFTFSMTESFTLGTIPWYIVLALFSAFLSLYFTRTTMIIESLYDKIKKDYLRLIIGGLVLGALILVLPPLYGEGYDTINSLLNGQTDELFNNIIILPGLRGNIWFVLLFLTALSFLKSVASSSTNGAGGVGGIFAPSLFIGGVNGFLVARLMNTIFDTGLSEKNFALVGMAGVMAGIMHAPLTAIFLIAEITGGYELLIPLIITSTLAYMTVIRFDKHSIYHTRLARRGELITHHKDKAVLTRMDWTKEIETDLQTVKSNDTLGSLVEVISRSKRNIFPVVDEYGILEGVVLLDNVREVMFNRDEYEDTIVNDLMIMPPSYIDRSDRVEDVMSTFKKTGAWNLPVLNGGKYVGFLSKSRIFSTYRELLMEVSED
jgi:CIC family chloride channel protein